MRSLPPEIVHGLCSVRAFFLRTDRDETGDRRKAESFHTMATSFLYRCAHQLKIVFYQVKEKVRSVLSAHLTLIPGAAVALKASTFNCVLVEQQSVDWQPHILKCPQLEDGLFHGALWSIRNL